MPKLGNVWEIDAESDYQRRCNPDGSCSGCGECCSDFLSLSDEENKRIKAYVKKYKLKPHYNAAALMTGASDLTCPFRDSQKKQCDIYSIRPEICRAFICSKSFDEAQDDRKLLEKQRNPYSMRCEFFEDNRNAELLCTCVSTIASMVACGFTWRGNDEK